MIYGVASDSAGPEVVPGVPEKLCCFGEVSAGALVVFLVAQEGSTMGTARRGEALVAEATCLSGYENPITRSYR